MESLSHIKSKKGVYIKKRSIILQKAETTLESLLIL